MSGLRVSEEELLGLGPAGTEHHARNADAAPRLLLTVYPPPEY